MTEAPAAVPVPLTGTPAPEKKQATTTSYIVLELVGDGAWKGAEYYPARSAKAAITAHIAAKKIEAGTFVAVPSRSFDPITVKTETSTKLTFAS